MATKPKKPAATPAKKAVGAKAPAVKAKPPAPPPAVKAAPLAKPEPVATPKTRADAFVLASKAPWPFGSTAAEFLGHVDAVERCIRLGEIPKIKRTSRDRDFLGGTDANPPLASGTNSLHDLALAGVAPPEPINTAPPPPPPGTAFDASTGLPMSAEAKAVV